MPEIQEGQVWRYKNRPGEEASRAVVCRVEEVPKAGTVVHLCVEGVEIKNPAAPDGMNRVISHMPFALEAFEESVLELEATRPDLPDFEEGYAMWKSAFEQGEAGIFDVEIAEGIGS